MSTNEKTWSRVAFEIGCQCAQSQQVGFRKQPGFGPGGIEDRSSMSFRQDESIAVWRFRIFGIVSHHGKEKRRDDIGG